MKKVIFFLFLVKLIFTEMMANGHYLIDLEHFAFEDPKKIINKLIVNYEDLDEFTVDVNVVVDVEFLKVPESNAKMRYRKPDKFDIQSQGFSLIPKEGVNFLPHRLFQGKYTSFYVTDEVVDGFITAVVKIIPLEASDLAVSTIWIDKKHSIIRKIESTTKTQGTFFVKLEYPIFTSSLNDRNSNDKRLPSRIVYSFEIDKSMIAGLLKSRDKSKNSKNEYKRKDGKVVVSFSNYQIVK